MTAQRQRTDGEMAINALYREAEVSAPTYKRPIVPLGELVAASDLTCTELAGLTGSNAVAVLQRRGGIVESPRRVTDAPLAGFIFVTQRRGAIFVEQGDLLVRRRFSVAHELGHYLLHFRPLLQASGATGEPAIYEAMEGIPFQEAETEPDAPAVGHMTFTRPAETSFRGLSFVQMEREANLFAAEFLMPASVVRALADRFARTLSGEDLVWRLATEMLISSSAMRWRLRGLGIVSPVKTRAD